MLNNIFKYGIFPSVFLFSFLLFSSVTLAANYGSGLYNSGLYSATLPSVIANPSAGTYNTTQLITLTAEGSSSIRYSLIEIPTDCTAGTLYIEPISISSSDSIYVRACDTYNNSSTATFVYVIDSDAPSTAIATPNPGTYNSSQSVTLSATGSNSIRFSTSGIPEDCSSGTLYSNPIDVSTSQTIYVRACDNLNNSSAGSFSYIIKKATSSGSSGSSSSTIKVTTPTVSPEPIISNNTNTTPISINRNLSLKSRGDDVKALQTYLKNGGYSISITDGIFGPQTKSAVISFQKSNNLYPDGIVGPKTRELMITTNPTTTINTGDSSKYIFSKNIKLGSNNNDTTEVYQLQKFLNTHGYVISESGLYSPGNENQFFGLLVKKALIKFQDANKLEPDGIFGPKTRIVINSVE